MTDEIAITLYKELYTHFKRRISSDTEMFSTKEKICNYVDQNLTEVKNEKLRTIIIEIMECLQKDYEQEIKENKEAFDVLANAPWNKDKEEET